VQSPSLWALLYSPWAPHATIVGPGFSEAAEGLLTVYDAWNRLVEVWKDNGGATPDKQLVKTGDNKDTLLVKYQYDGLNRRIAKLIPSGESNWARTDYYYNESWQCLEERAETVAGETIPADEDHVKVQYVWDLRYIDAPVLRWRDTGGDPDLDETLYYCQDANMNVTALVEPDGDVAERYVYDPYGSLVHDANGNLLVHSADWSSTVTWPNSRKNEILFGGYRLDPETALYHVRHRMYHPTLGRWLQRDPIGYADGMGLYEYVGGCTTTETDPLGTYRALTLQAEKAQGLKAFKENLSKAMAAKCDKCCCPHALGGCKQDADKVADMVAKAWEFNFGRRGGTPSDDRAGGYRCYDWAAAFAGAARWAKPTRWGVKQEMARPDNPPKGNEQQVHFYAKFEACPAEKDRKEGATGCVVAVDDGFLGKSGYVHDYADWPSGWSRRFEEGQPGFLQPKWRGSGYTRKEPNDSLGYSWPPVAPPATYIRRSDAPRFKEVYGVDPGGYL